MSTSEASFLPLRWAAMLAGVLFVSGCASTDNANRMPVKSVPFAARANPEGELRKRILVLPFLDENVSRGPAVLEEARNSILRQMSLTDQFVIVKNSDFPKDFSAFILDNREYDLEKLSKVAAGLGVSAVVEGKILEIKARKLGDEVGIFRKIKARVETSVRVRVAAAQNGRLIYNSTRSGSVESETTRVGEYSFSDKFLEEDPKLIRLSVGKAFSGSLEDMTKAIDKLSWEGRVALVTGERVFINAGRLTGIQIGDLLKVTEEGGDVFDPETGIFIGKAPGRMKGTVEVVSYFGKDGAIGVVHSGSGFAENDRVELY